MNFSGSLLESSGLIILGDFQTKPSPSVGSGPVLRPEVAPPTSSQHRLSFPVLVAYLASVAIKLLFPPKSWTWRWSSRLKSAAVFLSFYYYYWLSFFTFTKIVTLNQRWKFLLFHLSSHPCLLFSFSIFNLLLILPPPPPRLRTIPAVSLTTRSYFWTQCFYCVCLLSELECGGIHRLHSRAKDLPHYLPSSLSSSSLKTVTLSHVWEISLALHLPAQQRLISGDRGVRECLELQSGLHSSPSWVFLLVFFFLVVIAVGQVGLKEPGCARCYCFFRINVTPWWFRM